MRRLNYMTVCTTTRKNRLICPGNIRGLYTCLPGAPEGGPAFLWVNRYISPFHFAAGFEFRSRRRRWLAGGTARPSSRTPCKRNRQGVRAGGEKYALRCAGSLCHACSVRPPASRVLHSAPLRSGRDSQGNGASRLDPPQRATVARSLRSLRPHHSRAATGHALRPRWLPCASVSQQTVTAGRNNPHGSTQLRGATS